jgi:hypothetical protein
MRRAGLEVRLLVRMRARKGRYGEQAVRQRGHRWKGVESEFDILSGNDMAGDADIRQPRLRAERKRRRRTLRQQPLIGRQSLGGPVPAPLIDGFCVGAKGRGEMVADAGVTSGWASATVTMASARA